MTYREFMAQLADRVGRQHLPVNNEAADINEFLDDGAVHHELAKRIVRELYKANHCGHLDAKIEAGRIFDQLGRIQGAILRNASTDLDQVRLLEAIGQTASKLLPEPRLSAPEEPAVEPEQAEPSGEVREFSRYVSRSPRHAG